MALKRLEGTLSNSNVSLMLQRLRCSPVRNEKAYDPFQVYAILNSYKLDSHHYFSFELLEIDTVHGIENKETKFSVNSTTIIP